MRTGKKIVKTAEVIETHNYCDFCNQDLDRQKSFQQNSATIEMYEGIYYPEADCRTVTYLDVCTECFKEKIIPAVESLKIKFRERDADDYAKIDKLI